MKRSALATVGGELADLEPRLAFELGLDLLPGRPLARFIASRSIRLSLFIVDLHLQTIVVGHGRWAGVGAERFAHLPRLRTHAQPHAELKDGRQRVALRFDGEIAPGTLAQKLSASPRLHDRLGVDAQKR
jgi:hypothetical protein